MPVASKGIDIDKQQVSNTIGYSTDCETPARIVSLIDEYVENAHYLIDPSYSCIIRNIQEVHSSKVFIEDSIVLQSKVIARLLERCHKVAMFLLTIGNHLEETAGRLAEDGLILQATVLEAIGSVAAEGLAGFVQGKVAEIAKNQGLVTSQRFSPGYCDWNISQQKEIFQAMNGALAGIHLSDEYLMIPRKSVSGVIGIGPTSNGVQDYNPCITCPKRDCLGRR